MFGDITVSSRPLRLALLIRPTHEDFLKAVQLNCTLWGGALNPIVALYKRAPKQWRTYPRERVSVEERVLGYLRAFDPDILVDVSGSGVPPYITQTDRLTIKSKDIWPDFPRESIPKYGVGVFELIDAMYRKYFEHVRRFPAKVLLPIFPTAHRLLWSSLLGEWPSAFKSHVTANFSERVDIDEPLLDSSNFHALASRNGFPPRRITRFEVSQRPAGIRDRPYALFFDASHLADLIDLWNLRALGRNVFPLPKQYAFEENNLEAARKFIKDHFQVSAQKTSLTFGTNIIRGQSATMTELQAYAKALDMKAHMPEGAHSIGLQHWFPRIWDEWAITKDAAAPDALTSKTEEHSFHDTDGRVSFKGTEPEFGRLPFPRFAPRYANDISLKFYGGDDKILADVLPYDHGEEVIRAAGLFSPSGRNFRIGRSGLVHLCSRRDQVRLNVPLAEDVFFAWLVDKGYVPELSTCGLLAKQINAHLKGWTSALTHEALLTLLDRMNSGGEEGRGADVGEVKNKLKAISSHGDLYRSLSERGMFQLGFKTQCPLCRRGSWYRINDLGSELTCPLCHRKISAIAAVDTDNKGTWHLKTAGPFSVGNHADGSYSVLLTLNAFERDSSLQTTPVLSFKATSKSGQEIEADFAMLWRERAYGETEEGVLFAECKSYNEFLKEDFDRMEILAREFPGAILAFCMLRRELTPREIRAIRRIARAGRKYWKAERPLNPVLIFTGNELFGFDRAPYCWKKSAVPDWTKNVHTLLQICNATQAIYLGLQQWGKQWQEDFDRRRSKKAQKSAPQEAAT